MGEKKPSALRVNILKKKNLYTKYLKKIRPNVQKYFYVHTTMRSYHSIICPKDADRTANYNEDPDQTWGVV